MKQIGLLPLEALTPRVRYDLLFEHLPSLSLREQNRGRPSLPREALLKALVYKALRRLKTLTDLTFELQNNPTICQAVGLDPYQQPPSIERFSQFLRGTPHAVLQEVRVGLVRMLLQEGVITARHLVMDSCAIPAKVRENNLKSSVSRRFDKTRSPKGDPDDWASPFISLNPSKKRSAISGATEITSWPTHRRNSPFGKLPILPT